MWFEILVILCAGIMLVKVSPDQGVIEYKEKLYAAVLVAAAWFYMALYRKTYFVEQTEKSIFMEAAKIVTYALLDVTAVTVVCKPLGRVQFAVLTDGTLTVHYGVSALLLAVLAAVVIGVSGAVIERRYSNPNMGEGQKN